MEQVIADCHATLQANTEEYEKKLNLKEAEMEQLCNELLQKQEQPQAPKPVPLYRKPEVSPAPL